MLNEAKNNVYITGILSENALEQREYIKDGKTVKAISGTVKIKVPKDDTNVEIVVGFFAKQYTNAGALSKTYATLEDVMNNYKSIAACGEEEADWVRVSGGHLEMNSYCARSGNIVSFPRVRSNFINKVPKNSVPEANFDVEFYVAKLIEDDETGKLTVKGVMPKYDGSVDVFDFIPVSNNVKNGILNTWNVGDTVSAKGSLNFTVEMVKTEVEMAIGGNDVKTTRKSVNDIVIEKGSAAVDNGFDTEEINAALIARNAKMEELKNQPKKTTTMKVPAANVVDLGF